MLTRDQMLAADDRKIEELQIPEWGGSVLIRPLSGFERDQIEADFSHENKRAAMQNIRARFCFMSICNDKGERIFKEEDTATLGHKSAKALDRVFARVREISGLEDKDIKQLEKNSESDHNSGSGST